ncbi:hypothetical protein H4R33_005009 [Dimargaris cristalligena]|nr:hypothetical protein H4R33_005009 [Dimargaris cristalligena]
MGKKTNKRFNKGGNTPNSNSGRKGSGGGTPKKAATPPLSGPQTTNAVPQPQLPPVVDSEVPAALSASDAELRPAKIIQDTVTSATITDLNEPIQPVPGVPVASEPIVPATRDAPIEKEIPLPDHVKNPFPKNSVASFMPAVVSVADEPVVVPPTKTAPVPEAVGTRTTAADADTTTTAAAPSSMKADTDASVSSLKSVGIAPRSDGIPAQPAVAVAPVPVALDSTPIEPTRDAIPANDTVLSPHNVSDVTPRATQQLMKEKATAGLAATDAPGPARRAGSNLGLNSANNAATTHTNAATAAMNGQSILTGVKPSEAVIPEARKPSVTTNGTAPDATAIPPAAPAQNATTNGSTAPANASQTSLPPQTAEAVQEQASTPAKTQKTGFMKRVMRRVSRIFN